jgi:replicative DNA helicase
MSEQLNEEQKIFTPISNLLFSEDTNFLSDLLDLQEKYQNRGFDDLILPADGISTGFNDLDKMGCIRKCSVNLIASRPAMGKTALALNMAVKMARDGHVVKYLSFESRSKSIINRIISSEAEVESDKITLGSLHSVEVQRVNYAIQELSRLKLSISDKIPRTIESLLRYVEGCNEGDIIFIDYITLFRTNIEDVYLAYSNAVKALKLISLDRNLTIFVLSHLSNDIDKRQGHRPMMPDIPGTMAQDVDSVIFLLRRDCYDPLDKPGMAELIIAKNRNGGVGSVHLTFRKEISQFANYVPIKYDIDPEDAREFSYFSP